MNVELIDHMAQLAKQYAAIHAASGLADIQDNKVQLSGEYYRQVFPDYHSHKMEPLGGYVKVSHIRNDVEFLALMKPELNGDLSRLV